MRVSRSPSTHALIWAVGTMALAGTCQHARAREFSTQLQPRARFETMAFRRDWCQNALNGMQGLKDQVRKPLGLGPEGRRLAKVTHAGKQCRLLFKNIPPVRATNIHCAHSLLVCRIQSLLWTTF